MATAMTRILGDENVDLFSSIERSFDRGPGSFRRAVPERDHHVARVHQPLVAGRRPACVRQLLERSRHHLDRDPALTRGLRRRRIDSGSAAGDDRSILRERPDVVRHPVRRLEMTAADDADFHPEAEALLPIMPMFFWNISRSLAAWRS